MLSFFYKYLIILLLTQGCQKWVKEKKTEGLDGLGGITNPDNSYDRTPNGEPPENPNPGNILESDLVDKGKLFIFVKNSKGRSAYFKTCIGYKALWRENGENISKSKEVGCNKSNPLQPEIEYLEEGRDFRHELPPSATVELAFNYETWKRSSCQGCEHPFEGEPDFKRNFPSEKESFRCLKTAPGKYYIYYEDQPTSSHEKDSKIRNTVFKKSAGDEHPSKYDPRTNLPSRDEVYIIPDDNMEEMKQEFPCLFEGMGSGENEVTEDKIQSCYGIDFKDLIVKIEAEDVNIFFGENNEICRIPE